MSWLQDFTALTVSGVIRRAEQEYLPEPVSKPLLLGRGSGRRWWIMVANGDCLLAVEYCRRLMGKSTVTEELFGPGMRCVLDYSAENPILVIRAIRRAIFRNRGLNPGDYWRRPCLRTYDAEGELLTEWAYHNFVGTNADVVKEAEGEKQ